MTAPSIPSKFIESHRADGDPKSRWARTVVEGFWHGLHRSPYHGFSVGITEYRPYSVGDDPRYLDWKLVARTDRFFIKKYEDETNLRAHLLVDGSRSMSFGSRGYTKAEYAATFAATLAYFLHHQGDAVGLLTFDETVREYLPGAESSGHLRQLISRLEHPAGDRPPTWARRCSGWRSWSKTPDGGAVGDLLGQSTSWRPVSPCSPRRVTRGLVFQVLDPAEIKFSFDPAAKFRNLETGAIFSLDPAQARAGYQRAFEAHRASVRGICERLGITLELLLLDQPLELALYHFILGRARRGRTVRRRSQPR